MTSAVLKQRNLLGIRGMTAGEIAHILDTAETFREISEREIKKVPTLRGRTVINLFFEPSTRTRTSFEIAGKRLSADVINFSAKGSSVSKGESLKDTALTLEAMGSDAIVMHPGPMNRGMEIAADVADSVRSTIVEQVGNGVSVRMAVLYLLLGGTPQ